MSHQSGGYYLPDPDRVLSQVERTRELLERVRDRVEECNRDRAHALMRVAFTMQQRAEAAIEGGLRAAHWIVGHSPRPFVDRHVSDDLTPAEGD